MHLQRPPDRVAQRPTVSASGRSDGAFGRRRILFAARARLGSNHVRLAACRRRRARALHCTRDGRTALDEGLRRTLWALDGPSTRIRRFPGASLEGLYGQGRSCPAAKGIYRCIMYEGNPQRALSGSIVPADGWLHVCAAAIGRRADVQSASLTVAIVGRARTWLCIISLRRGRASWRAVGRLRTAGPGRAGSAPLAISSTQAPPSAPLLSQEPGPG